MESIKKIKVSELLQKVNAVSIDDGEKVYKEIVSGFNKSTKVELDFKQIELTLTAFFNAAIGQLYSKYDSPFLQNNLILINISIEDLNTLKKATDRAKEYFLDKSKFEKIAKKS